VPDHSRRAVETRWIGESLAATARELRLFLSTAAAVTVRPARFAAEWVRGQRQALNPLGFMATAAALVTVAATLASRLARLGGSSTSLVGEALESLGPYLHYVALGLICHGVMLLAGSRRSVGGSIALSLYLGGGPGTVATLVDLALFVVVQRWFGKVNFSGAELMSPPVLAMGILAWALRLGVAACFVGAFAGLHQRRTGWAVLGLVVALAVTGLIFGLLDPPGRFGMHLVIGHAEGSGRSWWPAWSPM
jgi:hypothetical protein